MPFQWHALPFSASKVIRVFWDRLKGGPMGMSPTGEPCIEFQAVAAEKFSDNGVKGRFTRPF